MKESNNKSNENLRNLYNNVYKDGKLNFFTFDTGNMNDQVLNLDIFDGKKVLDFGCGQGEVDYDLVTKKGAKEVLAIDYSEEAIKIAKEKNSHPNIRFECKTYTDVNEKFDIIISIGVLEHTNNPFEVLKFLKNLLNENGKIVQICPSFLNIRGYIWMTLNTLFNVPMSLSDIHFISPFDFEEFSKKLDMDLEWKTFDYSLGNSDKMIVDMTKRLTNALRDAKMDNSKVPDLMEWLKKASKYENDFKHTGASGLYILSLK
ncbi:MAG: class I SAM-dependent methyltransferase [Candidatus Pacearchaeota archaeon]|jgi:SAM-dependent methyltransferase